MTTQVIANEVEIQRLKGEGINVLAELQQERITLNCCRAHGDQQLMAKDIEIQRIEKIWQ